jgi:flagellar hook-basal body complex protein FliE
MSSPITPVQLISLPQTAAAGAASSVGGTGAFQSMLEGMIAPVEKSQAQATQAAQSFLNGGDEELHSVALAAQRADLQFNLFMQVRNKAVSAYQEIMRMQV